MLLARFNQLKHNSLEIDIDKAVYKKSSLEPTKDYYYTANGNENNRYLYYFEVLTIPIKNDMDADRIIISGVNYSTSITNRSYFSGQYTNTYQWYSKDKNEEDLTAGDIDEIIRKSMARKDIGDNENISSKKLNLPCVVIAHLVSQKIHYRGGDGKSQLNLEPFSTTIAETIEEAVRHLPSKETYYPSGVKKWPNGNILTRKVIRETLE